MKFIEVTRIQNNSKVYLNVHNIVAIESSSQPSLGTCSAIFLADKTTFYSVENYDQLKKLLQEPKGWMK